MKKISIEHNFKYDDQLYLKLKEKLFQSEYILKLIADFKMNDDDLNDPEVIVNLSRMLDNFNNCFECKKVEECKNSDQLQIDLIKDDQGELKFIEYSCHQIQKLDTIQLNTIYDNYIPRNYNKLEDISVLEYLVNLKNMKIKESVLIVTNKIATIDTMIHNIFQRLAQFATVSFIDFTDFTRRMKSSISNQNIDLDFLNEIADSDYLYISGLGLQRFTAFSRDDLLLNLLANRGNQKVTIISSTVDINQLDKLFLVHKEYLDNFAVRRIISIIEGLITKKYLC